MICVTGAAGFISSCLVGELNKLGFTNLLLIDEFNRPEKEKNYASKQFTQLVDRSTFLEKLPEYKNQIEFIFHLGARTDTTEFNVALFDELNLNYSKTIWNFCTENNIPLVYASSAATYGGGEFGYEDSHDIIEKLVPLNPYGESKNDFDKWVLQQTKTPPFWAGLKFFNVYGPNEYHKGRMASVVFHTFHQIKKSGKMKLFMSHNPNYSNGEQQRDFVYVKDVVSVCEFLMTQKPQSGIYNLGSGKARTFNDLAISTFKSLGLTPQIEYIPTPEDIRDKYQYFTEASMQKLINQGYKKEFYSLEEGVEDYVKNYLSKEAYL